MRTGCLRRKWFTGLTYPTPGSGTGAFRARTHDAGAPTNFTEWLQRNNLSCRIQTPQITRIARNYDVLPLHGDYNDRPVDNIRGARGTAEFSAGTGRVLVKRNNPDFLAPQKPRALSRLLLRTTFAIEGGEYPQ